MASFLGFAIRGDESVDMGFDDDSASTRSGSLTYRGARSRAMAFRWSFMVEPDPRWNPRNIAGVLNAHRLKVKRAAFDWPGVALNEAGHKEAVDDKTIAVKASLGDSELTLDDVEDLLPGRLIQLPGGTRVYAVTGVSNSKITIAPDLRNKVPVNSALKATIVPRVIYDPETDYHTSYRNSRPIKRIRLVEV